MEVPKMGESEKVANPAPLGLLGFGMTTVLLNFVHNVGATPTLDSMILAMGIAYGGLAQIIAGVMEYKRGNTFGTVAFTSYGLFWWSFVLLTVMPKCYLSGIPGPSNEAMAAYFFVWGIFTLAMFFGTLKTNKTLQFVFISLAILFFLLATKSTLTVYATITDLELFTRIIGAEGVICGLSAMYLAIADVLNETHGRSILPT
jgi:succinate-acetate transporter protein